VEPGVVAAVALPRIGSARTIRASPGAPHAAGAPVGRGAHAARTGAPDVPRVVGQDEDGAVSELAERFARELAAVAGTPHAGANAAEVALEVAGQTPIVAAVDDDTDGDGGSGGVGLDAIAGELAR